MKFGEKVRDLRKKHSLTQDELAQCLGIQHRPLHEAGKEYLIVTLRQFLQFLHKGIRIAGAACDDQLFIRLDILECLNQISNPLLRHQTTEEQYVGILFQSKMILDQPCLPNLWPIDTIRDKMRLPSIGLQEILLHSFAQNNDLVRIFRSIFFALVDKLRAKS